MAHRYKPRRNKLKSHDSGEDRHNKPVAYLNKVSRTASEHQQAVSGVQRRKEQPTTLKQLKKLLRDEDWM